MPKLLIPVIGIIMASAAVLLVPRAEATAVSGLRLVPGATSAVEKVAQTCVRRRACLPGKGCVTRTVCKRAPGKTAPGM